ncbi:MAG TPA: monovalent cation/H(+) antiporter subunit G [Candidatus Limnocylindria bacterium]|nr:monovalent cation/H(+) antiporter subunit G [Candidatus Limnocylindria bacterium]
MNDFLSGALLLVGAGFLLLASIGILRMPDLFNRMQTASKAATLGISCILLAVALRMEDPGLALRCVLTIVFFFLTAPVAAHIIGRAAYFVGVPLWKGTIADELRGHYDMETHRLSSDAPSGEHDRARTE